MGFVDGFKKLMSGAEDDDFETVTAPSHQNDDFGGFEPVQDAVSQKKNKVVNIHATTQLQVVLVKPERFDDAASIADHLNSKRTVVLNLENTNKDVSRRIVDFLSGVAYANNGQLKKVANSTFIITPYNVGIMGDDLLDELENNGVYF